MKCKWYLLRFHQWRTIRETSKSGTYGFSKRYQVCQRCFARRVKVSGVTNEVVDNKWLSEGIWNDAPICPSCGRPAELVSIGSKEEWWCYGCESELVQIKTRLICPPTIKISAKN